jgi:hypothetical protein
MTKKIAFSLMTFALALAFGATVSTYHLSLSKPAVVSGTEFKAGDYKVELDGNKATLKSGKNSVETEVNVENNGTKFSQTTACCLGEDGKYHLQELRLGGTTTKLTFKETGKDGGPVAGR